MSQASHLVRRWAGSMSRREPAAADTTWAESFMLGAEVQLWRQMNAPDRRHSIMVGRRFASMGTWSREEMVAALLHDVGKLESSLGTTARVVATVVGPRTARLRRYHDHERIGADMLARAGSSPVTIDLLRGIGRAVAALAEADNV